MSTDSILSYKKQNFLNLRSIMNIRIDVRILDARYGII